MALTPSWEGHLSTMYQHEPGGLLGALLKMSDDGVGVGMPGVGVAEEGSGVGAGVPSSSGTQCMYA